MDWESRKKELHTISSSKQLGMTSLDIMNEGMTQKESWPKPCGKTFGWVREHPDRPKKTPLLKLLFLQGFPV